MQAAIATEKNEERLGHVVVRAVSRDHDANYRDPASAATLVIERARIPFRLTRAQFVAIGIAGFLTIAVAILTVATFARAAMCVVPVPTIAVAVGVMIAFLRVQRMSLTVGAGHLSMTRPLRSERAPIDHVEEVGVGTDALHRSLWVRVRGQGRVLVLDGLDENEAAFAARRLREALDLS